MVSFTITLGNFFELQWVAVEILPACTIEGPEPRVAFALMAALHTRGRGGRQGQYMLKYIMQKEN